MIRKGRKGGSIVKHSKFLLTGILLFVLLLLPVCTSCGHREQANPEEYVRNLTWAIGTVLPSASDYALPGAPAAEYAFDGTHPYEHIAPGMNRVSIRVTPGEKRAFVCDVFLTLITDTEAPTAVGIGNRETVLGRGGISYWSGITVSDNCDGPVTRTVLTDQVDPDKVGTYDITYRLTDAAGNVAEYPAKLAVVEQEFDEEAFYRQLDALIDRLGLRGLSVLEQCRRIYEYVNSDMTIHYTTSSNLKTRTNWMREASLALDSKGGDCYTYFALSKAFFERLGIENLDVQRMPGYTKDTHYWSMVNIGTSDAPRWYHFDATRLLDKVYDCGILTDAQVDAYSTDHKPYFYCYDRSAYPPTDTVEVSHVR